MNIIANKTDEEIEDLYEHIYEETINGSTINFVNHGSSGFGFRLYNPETKYRNLTLDNKNVICSNLFLKLVPILVDDEDMELNKQIRIETRIGAVQISSYSDFMDEVNFQIYIYKMSNSYLQSICPPIFYFNIIDNQESKELLDKIIEKMSNVTKKRKADESTDLEPEIVLKNSLNQYKGVGLGVVVMGYTENYISLGSVVESNLLSEYIKSYFQILSIVELDKLYDLGIIHGDFSLSNIMVNPLYKYLKINNDDEDNIQGRVMIIDFGAAYFYPLKNSNIQNSNTIQKRINYMLDTYSHKTGVIPRNYNLIDNNTNKRIEGKKNQYSWLEDIVNSHTNLNEEVNNIRVILDDKIIRLYNNVKIYYPDIIQEISNYNDDIDDEYTWLSSLMTGGRYKNIVQEPKLFMGNEITKKKQQYVISNEKRYLDKKEIDSFFNPNNLNMKQLYNDYILPLIGVDRRLKKMRTEILNKKITKGGKMRKLSRNVKKCKKKNRKTHKNVNKSI